MTVESDIAKDLEEFSRARDWVKLETPRNVATALVKEASEILEMFQWDLDNPMELAPERQQLMAGEIADVAMYLIRLADLTGVDIEKAVRDKLERNEQRFPLTSVLDPATGRMTRVDQPPQ
jgi:dCTP diphosphatase